MALSMSGFAEAVRTATTDPYGFGIGTGTSSDYAVVFSSVHGADTTDYIAGVTVDGGKVLTRIARAVDSTGEPGVAELWFWSASSPLSTNGSVSITVDLTSATGVDFQFVGWRLGAAGLCEVIDSAVLEGDVANPEITMNKGGKSAWSFGSGYFGANAPAGTISSGMSQLTEDLGNFWAAGQWETSVDTSDQAVGYSTLASDDVALAAICIAEAATAVDRGRPYEPQVYNPAQMQAILRNRGH